MANFMFSFVSLLVFLFVYTDAKYTLCARKESETICKQLEAQGGEVTCVLVGDSGECLTKMSTGSADFGVFSAEEALFAAVHQQRPQVIAEVPHVDRLGHKYDFQTVAVVKASSMITSLSDLRGKHYCHPGFPRTEHWTDPVLKAFEIKVLETQSPPCNVNKTFIEEYTESLSKFFTQACRPGKWATNSWLDEKLKKQYANLCALCDDPGSCSYKASALDSREPHQAALQCLTQGRGDVTYTALSLVRKFFNNILTPPTPSLNDVDYRFLCPNGTLQSLNTSEPCTWVKQPWPVILASNEEKALALNRELSKWYPDVAALRTDWKDLVKQILVSKSSALKILSLPLKSIKDYMAQARENPGSSLTSCRHDIQWCANSDKEAAKCSLLSSAGQTHGLVPRISCVQSTSFRECLLKVNSSQADVTAAPTQAGYIARSMMKLVPAAYVEALTPGHFIGVMVIRNDSSIKTKNDLKGKKACFPHFNGLGWLSYMEVARKASFLPENSCPSGKHTLSFFGDSCIPGVSDPKMNVFFEQAPKAACAACSAGTGGSCDAQVSNKFFGEIGALRCVSSTAGEVAFVNLNEIVKYIDSGKNDDAIKLNSLRILCNDDKIVKLTDNFETDTCAVTHFIGHEVLTRNEKNSARNKDIQHALEDLDDWFGLSGRFYKIFNLFGPFNGTNDLLLPSTGVDLVNKYTLDGPYVGSYDALHARLNHCSGVAHIIVGIITLILPILNFTL